MWVVFEVYTQKQTELVTEPETKLEKNIVPEFENEVTCENEESMLAFDYGSSDSEEQSPYNLDQN